MNETENQPAPENRESVVLEKKEGAKERAREFKRNFGTNWERFVGNDLVRRFYPDAAFLVWAVFASLVLEKYLKTSPGSFLIGFYVAVLTAPVVLIFSNFLAKKIGIEN
jgi:hypothetical protein